MKFSLLLLLSTTLCVKTTNGQCPLNSTIVNCFLNNLTASHSLPQFAQTVTSTLNTTGAALQASIFTFVYDYYFLLLGCGMQQFYLVTVACGGISFDDIGNITCVCLSNSSLGSFTPISNAARCADVLCTCPDGVTNYTTGSEITLVTKNCFGSVLFTVANEQLVEQDVMEVERVVVQIVGLVFNLLESLLESVASGLRLFGGVVGI